MNFLLFWIPETTKGGLEDFMWLQRWLLQKVEKHAFTEENGLRKIKDDNECGQFCRSTEEDT